MDDPPAPFQVSTGGPEAEGDPQKPHLQGRTVPRPSPAASPTAVTSESSASSGGSVDGTNRALGPGSGRSPQGIRHLLGCWEAGEADHAALRDRIGTSGAELLSEGTFGPAGKPLPSCSLGLASASPQSAATRVSTTTFVSRPRCPTCHQTPENLSDLLAVEPDGPPKLPLPAASTQPMPNAGEMPAETQSWPSCGACCDAWRPALTPLRVPTPSRELCPVLPRCALGSKPGLKTLGHRSFGKKWKRGHIFPGD